MRRAAKTGWEGHDMSGGTGVHPRGDRTALLGREQVQEQVAGLLAALPDGGRVLRLRGDAGTGKTAALRCAADTAARQGIDVLATASAPTERELPHAALHSLLRPRLTRLDELPAAERALIEAAFTGAPAERAPSPAHLARAVLSLLALAPGPVLVCVDDLDRLDPASRDTLREATRHCHHTRVGLVVAERAASEDWPGPTVTLGALPEPEARALVARAGRARVRREADLVVAVAQGNPLALTELSLPATGPGEAAGLGLLPATPRLAAAYEEDLKGLSAAAHGVLLTAALSTSPDTRHILDASTRLLGGEDTAREGLAETVRRRLVAEEGRHLRFPQPLLRLAVPYLTPGARRMAAHAALSRSLPSPPHAAWHAAQSAAAPDEDIARSLESLAAEPATGTGLLVALAAIEGAARLSPDPAHRARRLLRATELACDHGLREQAARCARAIDTAELGRHGHALLLWFNDLLPGDWAVGRERIAELCGAARAVAAEDPALARKLLHAAARRCWWQPAGPAERRMVVDAVEDLLPRPWDAHARLVMSLTEPHTATTEPEPAPSTTGIAVPAPADGIAVSAPASPATGIAAPVPAPATATAGPAPAPSTTGTGTGIAAPAPAPAGDIAVPAPASPAPGTVAPAPATAGPAPPAAGTAGPAHTPRTPDTATVLGQTAYVTGDLDRAASRFAEAEEAVRAAGMYGRLPHILVPRALGVIWRGTRWTTAEAMAEEARAIAVETGQNAWATRAVGVLGIVEALRGHHDRALGHAAEVEEASLRLRQGRQLSLASLARAVTASGTGRHAEAYAQLRSVITEGEAPYGYEQFWALAFLAEAALFAGESADARDVLGRVEAATPAGWASLPRRVLTYARAVLAPDEEAEDRYRDALGPGIERWPLLHGMTHFHHGARLRRRRRITESREPLATAESVFLALGARPRADLAALELRAAGRAADEPAATDVARLLSPQQLTIARLTARGLSNRAIGEQLRLSPRTVASHLYQIFPKLDVTSRAQLAARLDPH